MKRANPIIFNMPIWKLGVKQCLLNREEALKVADRLASESPDQPEQ